MINSVSSSMSNSVSNLVGDNYVRNNPNFKVPNTLPEQEFLSPESQNKLNDYAQQKINEKKENVTDVKDAKWQQQLGLSYIENQKNVINAYTMSASGETLYDTNNDKALSLTDSYDLMREEYFSKKYSLIANAEQPIRDNNPVNILPVDVLEQNEISTYQSVKNPVDNSILHLVA